MGMLPNYSGVAQAMPENIGSANVFDPVANAGVSLATLPYRALGNSANAIGTGTYNPAPTLEAATLPLGTGAIAGVPVQGAESVLGAGLIRKQPPLISVLHGTGSPAEFGRPTLPPATHDLGIHATISPNIAEEYAYPKYGNDPSKTDMMSGMKFNAPNAADVRIKPFLGDFQSALRYPEDAVKWNNPDNVINALESNMRRGFTTPRGLLEDMYNISSSPKTWQDQFVPMLKDKGYDSLIYPHAGSKGYNTFMGFGPEQFIPRFSPEGISLATERGIASPKYKWNEDVGGYIAPSWKFPKGVLSDPTAVESLVKDPRKNTFQWWDENAPSSKIKEISDKYTAEKSAAADKASADKANSILAQNLYDQYKKGYISEEAYNKGHNVLFSNDAMGALNNPNMIKVGIEAKLVNDFKNGKIDNQELFKQHQQLYGLDEPAAGAYFHQGPYSGTYLKNEAKGLPQGILSTELAALAENIKKKGWGK
jgi:hypothetical protein